LGISADFTRLEVYEEKFEIATRVNYASFSTQRVSEDNTMRKQYPWSRFYNWLRRQPQHRIAGSHGDYHDNPISDFLKAHGCYFPIVSDGGCYLVTPGGQAKPVPAWVAQLFACIDRYREAERYQYRTVMRALRRVVREYHDAER
jgi:hypothetical protein